MDKSKEKLCLELGILILFISLAILHSNITGMATNTAVVNVNVSKSTIPCTYLISPTIFEQNDYAYLASYTDNCGNQPMNLTINITASYKNDTIATTAISVDNFTLRDRDIALSLVFPINIPYSPDPKENLVNVTMSLNYTDYYNKNITGVIKIPRRLYVITKPPLLLNSSDREVIKQLVKNNSFEKTDKNTTKGFIETYSNYVQVSRENVSFPFNISEDLNTSDIYTCSANQTYLGEEVFCNVTLVKGHSYILHIGYGSVHIYTEDVTDQLIEQIRQELIAEGAINQSIIYTEDSKEITTVVEKEAPIALMDLDTTPHFTLLKNLSYITFIKVKNSGTLELNNIKVKLVSALKTNVLSNDQINLKPGESINIPIEIIPNIEGNYWIIAEVESDKTSKQIGINIDVSSDESKLKEALETYETLMKNIQANIYNYENIEDIKPLIDDSLVIINTAYEYYDLKEYEKVKDILEKLRENVFSITDKLSTKKAVIQNSSGTSPGGQFTFSRDVQDSTILLIITITISILLFFYYLKRLKCNVCGRKTAGFKCALCKKISKDKNHKCGKEHLIPICIGCRKIEILCRCKK
ncbi:MAG: hypothetical protein HY831_03600 [Candidatus Aenigmarchaeota archaeon]|nr:hypothetical protein [Candidatus Aenigmarchaeota archaeon]